MQVSKHIVSRSSNEGRRQRRNLAVKAGVEPLEKRLLFTTITSNAVNGDWSAASTWVGGVVPGGNDNATIVAGAHVTVTDNRNVETLNAQAGSDLAINGSGNLGLLHSNAGDSSTIAGSLEIASGAAITVDGPIGQLTVSGTSAVSGSFVGAVTDNTGSMTLAGGGVYGGKLFNDGAITDTSGGIRLGNGGIITNNAGGTFNLTSDAGPAPTTFPGLSGGTFINKGTLNKSGGTGVYNFPDYTPDETFYASVFENVGGTFNIDSGTFLVKGDAYLAGGAINVAANAVLMFTSPPLNVKSSVNRIGISGTVAGSGAGSIDFAQGDYQANSPTGAAAGTLNFPAGLLTLGAVEIDEVNGDVRNFITNAGFMNFNSATETAPIALINNGTIQNTGAGDLQFVEVTNNSAGVIDLKSNAGLASATVNIQQNLLNKGILRKSAGSGTSTVTATITETSTATIDVESGTLDLSPASTLYYQGGATNVATGAALDLGPTGSIIVGATWTSTGTGTIQLTGGLIRGRNDSSVTTIEGPSPAVLDFAPNVFSISAGEISGSNEGLTNSGSITVTTAVNFGTFTNAGTVIASGGTQYFFDGGITNLAGGVFEFDTDATIGLHGLFNNNGTVIKAGGTGIIDLSIFGAAAYPDGSDAFRNFGAIESTSGVLLVPSDFFKAGSDGKLDVQTGATVEAISGGTITIAPSWDDTATTITTIDGTAIIGGPGNPIPALASLATVNGTFDVQAGNSFTTAGALTNTGTLTVGGNVTVHGNLTESGANSTLNFAVSGAPGSSGAPVLAVQGSTALAGNLTATETGGFAAMAGSVYTVATFSPNATGSFASTAGVAPAFTVSATSGAIILNGTGNSGGGGGGGGTGNADLAVTSVTSVADQVTSSILNITYTVTNQGTGAASGSWNDSVFLTTNGSVDNSSILLLRDGKSGGLAAGASYTHTDIAFLPTVPVKSYEIVVLTDSGLLVPDPNRANNSGASAPFTTSFRTLTLGQETSAQIAGVQDVAYRLNLPVGKDVSIAATFTSAYNADLFVSYGTIPTTTNFQESLISSTATSGNLVIPVHQAGDYYVLVHGREGAGGGITYTLTPRQIDTGPLSITPSGIVQPQGNLTTTIKGSGFNGSTTVALVSGSTTVTPVKLLIIDSNTISASFYFDFPPPGNYDASVTTGGVTSTLPSAFFIGNGSGNGSNLTFSLVIPSFSRGDLTNTAYLQYANTGFVDVPAPYFYVSGDNTSFKLPGDSSFSDGSIELLGGSPSGNPAVLPPGASGIIPIQYTQTQIVSHQHQDISVFQVDPAATIDLAALKDDLRPANEPAGAWDVIYNNFLSMIGNSVGGLTTVLDEAATALATQGTYTPAINALLSYALQVAGGFGTITQRFSLTAYGRGQADPVNQSLAVNSSGNVTITAGGQERIFLIQPNSTYQGLNNDPAKLTVSNGVYSLTEADGRTTAFNADGTLAYSQAANGGQRLTASYSGGLLTSLVATNGDTYTFDHNSNGRVSQVTDPEGRATTYAYDATGELLDSVTSEAGTTTFTYITDPTSAARFAVSSISFPDGTSENYTYDSMGRLIKTSKNGGVEPVAYSYDALGATVTTTDALGNSSTETVGPAGAAALVGDALGNIGRLAYTSSGRALSQTSAGGYTTSTQFDSAGRPLTTTAADGSAINYSYDPLLNQLISITDSNGNTINVTYDSNGNAASITNAAGEATTYGHNSNGQISQMTSASGRAVSITYDSHGLVLQRAYSDGTIINYTYDAHRNLISATDASGTLAYTYNSTDQLTKVTYPNGLQLQYTYDSQRHLLQMVDQTNFATNYNYNSVGQLSSLTNGSGAMIASYTYNAIGHLIRQDNGNGSYSVYQYDTSGQTLSVVNHAADNSIASSFAYTYNTDGERTSEATLAGITTYSYDAVGQLINAVLPGGRTITYSYDANGNRSVVADSAGGSVNYQVNNTNEYVSVGGKTYTYDADGNLTAVTDVSGTTSYTYNIRGQVASVTSPGGTDVYGYDAMGDRISTTHNGVITEDLTDPSGNNLVGQFDANGAAIAHYVYGAGLTSDVAADGSSSFYGFDGSGNTADVSGSNGAVTATYSYLPFGQVLSQTGSASQPFTFGGILGVVNDGQGLYYMRAREYDSAAGRFVQRDPQSILGSDVNQYRYAGNDPIDRADPTGFVEITTASGDFYNEIDVLVRNLVEANGQEVATSSWQRLELSALRNIQASYARTAGVYVKDLVADIGAKLGAEVTVSTFDGAPLAEVVSGLASKALATGAANIANIASAIAIKEGEQAVIASAAGAGVFAAAEQVTFGVTASVVTNSSQVLAAPFLSLESALGIGQVGYIALKAIADANEFNNDFPDGIPLPEQEAINGEAYGDALKRPLASELIHNLERQGITPTEEFRAAAIRADADLIRLRNAPSNTIGHIAQTAYVNAHDPNDIIGPVGFGTGGFIQGGIALPYEITFENDPKASAPAKVVTIVEQLDPNLDWTSFQLTGMGFGSHAISVPAGLTSYQTSVDVSDALRVDISASFNVLTGAVKWTFTSIDPTTGDIPAGALAGFLPPDDAAGNGDGYVSYFVRAKIASHTGTQIHAQGSITFDGNAAIATPNLLNTIDIGAPTSSVSALPTTESSPNFTVNWSGQDDTNGSGIVSYNILVSKDGGAFNTWIASTTATSAIYVGAPGHSYAFESIATDGAGNLEVAPTASQATTAVPAADRFITIDAKHRGTYTDAAGNLVAVILAGLGSGTLAFIGSANADPVSFIITGTTARSRIAVAIAKGVTTLSDIQITGSLAAFTAAKADLVGDFTISGTLGSLTLKDANIAASTIEVDGAAIPTAYRLGILSDLSIISSSRIRFLIASQWTAGLSATDWLTAPSVAAIRVKGAFDANVTLASSALSLGTFASGSITGGMWLISGSTRSILAGSIASGWSGTFTGGVITLAVKGDFAGSISALSIARFQAASITNATIKFSGSLAVLAVTGTISGSISASSIKLIQAGSMNGATINLNGAGTALVALRVRGSVTDSTISSAGSIGRVTLGGATGSSIFAGVNPAISNVLPTAGDFTTASTIGIFIETGRAAFSDTFIAAAAITRASLTKVTTDNGGVPFGIATKSLKTFSLLQPKTKPFLYTSRQPASALDALPGDLRVEVLDG